MTAEITQPDYESFRLFLHDACGILLGAASQKQVRRRLLRILGDHGLAGLPELADRLAGPGRNALREQVIDLLTRAESRWFTDELAFRFIAEQWLPAQGLPAQERNHVDRPLAIWSAACCTGEEPYGVAMLIEEFREAHPGRLADVTIVATDVAKGLLDTARQGEYDLMTGEDGLSAARRAAFFSQTGPDRWQVSPELRARVGFRKLNLREQSLPAGFDLVLCRNVLRYFTADVRQDLLTRVHRSLNPGGYLVLASTEAISGLTDLYEPVQCSPGIVYRKK